MSSQHYESRFWVRWLLVGLLAGALAGAIATGMMLTHGARTATFWRSGTLPIMAILGGVYGMGQGIAQFLSLRNHIPRLGRSLQVNFVGTVVGGIVTAISLFWLWAIGFADLLNHLGFSSTLNLTLGMFIVGGFGGIAQAIVERSLLRAVTYGSYFRWIAPLALLGHVSGALAGMVTSLIQSGLG